MLTLERDQDAGSPTSEAPAIELPTVDVRRTRRSRWPWALAGVVFMQNTLIGAWLLYTKQFGIGDSLSRTAAAKLVVLSRDPHLGAMGFYWMPLPTLARIPFVLVTQPFGHADMAGPMSSAMFVALTIPVLAATGRLLHLRRVTPIVVVIFAFSPVTAWMGADAMSEAASGLFLALTFYGWLRWRQDGRVQSLIVLGLSLGGSATCRYEPLVLIPVIGVAVAFASVAAQRRQAVVLALLPAVVVYIWWFIASDLIMGDGLYWYHLSRFTTATPTGAKWLPTDREVSSLVGFSLGITFTLAPAALAVVAGALAVIRQWRTSLGVVGLLFAIPLLVTLQLIDGSSWAVPRFYILTPLLASMGVLWLLHAAGERRTARSFGALGVALLAVGAVSGTYYLASPRNTHAEGEFVFFRAVLGRSEAVTSGEYQVYNRNLLGFRQLAADLDPFLARGDRVLVDTYGSQIPSVMTRQPDRYIVPEDRDWEPTLSSPSGRFRYVIRMLSENKDAPSPYKASVDRILGIVENGSWQLIHRYAGSAELFEWVATGDQPTMVIDGEPAVPFGSVADALDNTALTQQS